MTAKFMKEPANNGMTHPATSGQATVLLVDDSAEVREFLACLLRVAGYRVLLADGAPQAQQMADDDGTIELLVTDLRMPGMNGVELARWFHSRFPLRKALLVSASGCEIEAYLETTPWLPFLNKTEALTRLVTTVEELLTEGTTHLQGSGATEIAKRASA